MEYGDIVILFASPPILTGPSAAPASAAQAPYGFAGIAIAATTFACMVASFPT
jgi:hypothetical protein